MTAFLTAGASLYVPRLWVDPQEQSICIFLSLSVCLRVHVSVRGLSASCVQVWPRTHVPLWQHVRECKLKGLAYHPYQDQTLQRLKRASEPEPCHLTVSAVQLLLQFGAAITALA